MLQPPPPTEQGKLLQRHCSQPGSQEPQPPPTGTTPHGDSPCKQPLWRRVPMPKKRLSGHCSCHAFCWPACMERACLPGLLSSCLEGFVWLFFFFPPSFSWECIVYFQQQPADPGDNSAATRPGTGTTWTHFRHLASHKEGGRETKGIDTLCPKGKQIASIDSGGHRDLHD